MEVYLRESDNDLSAAKLTDKAFFGNTCLQRQINTTNQLSPYFYLYKLPFIDKREHEPAVICLGMIDTQKCYRIIDSNHETIDVSSAKSTLK